MLQLLNRNKPFVGLDIGSSILKVVELRLSRKDGFELASLGFEEIPPDCIVDGALLSKMSVCDTIRRVFIEQHIQNRRVSTSVAGHSVIVKKISLPFERDEELAESVRYEAEKHIPFDIADVNLDYQILHENAQTGDLDILLAAARKDRIADYAQVIKTAGKTPVWVEVDAFALQNAYELNYEPNGKNNGNNVVALLDIGASTMTIHIVAGTDFLFTRNVGTGGRQYTERIQKEFNLTRGQARALKHGDEAGHIDPLQIRRVIDSVSEIICLEIQKTYDFFKSTKSMGQINRMIVSGGAAHTPGLIETLARKFVVPVEKFDSFRKIRFDKGKFSPSMIAARAPDLAIAIGLALRGASPPFSPGFTVEPQRR